jgi:hypothetical protein
MYLWQNAQVAARELTELSRPDSQALPFPADHCPPEKRISRLCFRHSGKIRYPAGLFYVDTQLTIHIIEKQVYIEKTTNFHGRLEFVVRYKWYLSGLSAGKAGN